MGNLAASTSATGCPGTIAPGSTVSNCPLTGRLTRRGAIVTGTALAAFSTRALHCGQNDTSDPSSSASNVAQLQQLLEVAGLQSEVAEEEETPAIPVPAKVLAAMRRCEAGVIAVTVEESRKDRDGNYTLNENVLIEIGSAFVLYDQRVALLWDKRLKVASTLQGLYRCESEGGELTWAAGVKLMQAIQGFKKKPG